MGYRKKRNKIIVSSEGSLGFKESYNEAIDDILDKLRREGE